MRFRLLALFALASALAASAIAQDSTTSPANPPQGPDSGRRGQGGGRGWGGMIGGRGVMGTVTAADVDHYTVKTETGELYTIRFSSNTRILKQPAQRQSQSSEGGERTPPQPIKPTDIKVGDAIAANGEVDQAAKSVGAVVVFQIDPERAKQMREMEANFGKTWLAGKVTAVNETKITLQSPMDNNAHTFVADENTSFRKRREMITLADVQVGDNVRVEGAVKDGTFMAATVAVMSSPANGGPVMRQGPPPQ